MVGQTGKIRNNSNNAANPLAKSHDFNNNIQGSNLAQSGTNYELPQMMGNKRGIGKPQYSNSHQRLNTHQNNQKNINNVYNTN